MDVERMSPLDTSFLHIEDGAESEVPALR